MTEITPEFVQSQVARARPYVALLLKRGPNFDARADLQMPHLLHIFSMRDAGQMLLTLPVMQPGDLVGIGLFAMNDKDEAERLVQADPAVQGGRLTYELVSCMGIPGDTVA